jgi:predicted transcriptional regulator
MRVAARCCHDTMPPLRRVVLADVAANPDSFTPDVADRVQIPKTTIDRTLQELQLLGLLRVAHIRYGAGERIRWMYSLAPGVDPGDLAKCTRNVSTAQEEGSSP